MTLTGGERGGTLGLDTLGEDEEEGGKKMFFGSPRHHKGALNLLQGEEHRRVWGGRKEGNKEDGEGEGEEKVGKEETIV